MARHASKTCDNPDSEADDADKAVVLSDYRRILVSSVSSCNAGVICSPGNEDWLS